MWYKNSVFYQIYPLTLLGAPKYNNGIVSHRFQAMFPFVDYLEDLGIKALYLNPIFSSDSHGYDTRDYRKIDERLGDHQDFVDFVQYCHNHHLKVVLDGVFNHVGRGFFAFEDVKQHLQNSRYKDWFYIHFDGDSNYQDGFYYEGWEGHYELVKLNLDNKEVQEYLMDAVKMWIQEFDIDGIRLDVAYSLPRWFMAMLKERCSALKDDFFLVGEVLGDNAGYMFDEARLDSITDYPTYKALWSSFNSLNMFELAHTLKRNYQEMYKGKSLLTFVDNHDVARIASQIEDEKKLPLLYALFMALPGIPCLYYGSEWGQKGKKEEGSDDSLRPTYSQPMPNELTAYIKTLIHIKNEYPALQEGTFEELLLTNRQYVFQRVYQGQRIIVALNIDDQPYELHFDAKSGTGLDLISKNMHDFGGGSTLAAYSISYWLTE